MSIHARISEGIEWRRTNERTVLLQLSHIECAFRLSVLLTGPLFPVDDDDDRGRRVAATLLERAILVYRTQREGARRILRLLIHCQPDIIRFRVSVCSQYGCLAGHPTDEGCCQSIGWARKKNKTMNPAG